MGLYADALRDLGGFLGARSALAVVAPAARPSASRRSWRRHAVLRRPAASSSARRSPPNDLALAGVAEFDDLDRLTVFADNLVPHVLRMDGVLRYDPELAARIDAGELLEPGAEELEIRACAVHACELLAARLGVPPAHSNGGCGTAARRREYKARPRHRARSVLLTSRRPGSARRGAQAGGPRRVGCSPARSATRARARRCGWPGR